MEKYSHYKFEIQEWNGRYDYLIYTSGCYPYCDGKIESTEFFDTEKEARFAAIGHIDKLENGEGQDA